MDFLKNLISRGPRAATVVEPPKSKSPWVDKTQAVDISHVRFTAELEGGSEQLHAALKTLREKAYEVASDVKGGVDKVIAAFDKPFEGSLAKAGFTGRTISECYNQFSAWVGLSDDAKITVAGGKSLQQDGKYAEQSLGEADMAVITQSVKGRALTH